MDVVLIAFHLKKKKTKQPMEVFGKEHKVNFSTYVFT